jgi:hypothetical protein
VYDCSAGISLASENGGLLENIRIYNNLVYNNRLNGIEIGNWGEEGVAKRPIKNISIVNNTAYKNGSGDWGGGFHLENPDVSNVLVRNNIFSQNLTYQMLNEVNLAPGILKVDHNLIDGFREFDGETRGRAYVEGDPQFVDPSENNFKLRESSPAIDRGSASEAPSSDFEGGSRPLGRAHDLGAFEYHN